MKLKDYKFSSAYLSGKPDQKLSAEYCCDSDDGKQDRQGFRANVKRQREKGGHVFLRENLKNKYKK